jgi:hypothetical protein
LLYWAKLSFGHTLSGVFHTILNTRVRATYYFVYMIKLGVTSQQGTITPFRRLIQGQWLSIWSSQDWLVNRGCLFLVGARSWDTGCPTEVPCLPVFILCTFSTIYMRSCISVYFQTHSHPWWPIRKFRHALQSLGRTPVQLSRHSSWHVYNTKIYLWNRLQMF